VWDPPLCTSARPFMSCTAGASPARTWRCPTARPSSISSRSSSRRAPRCVGVSGPTRSRPVMCLPPCGAGAQHTRQAQPTPRPDVHVCRNQAVPTGEMPRSVSLSCERYLVDKVSAISSLCIHQLFMTPPLLSQTHRLTDRPIGSPGGPGDARVHHRDLLHFWRSVYHVCASWLMVWLPTELPGLQVLVLLCWACI
jgi:hypothetical protein